MYKTHIFEERASLILPTGSCHENDYTVICWWLTAGPFLISMLYLIFSKEFERFISELQEIPSNTQVLYVTTSLSWVHNMALFVAKYGNPLLFYEKYTRIDLTLCIRVSVMPTSISFMNICSLTVSRNISSIFSIFNRYYMRLWY